MIINLLFELETKDLVFMKQERFNMEDAKRIGEQIGILWEKCPFDVKQFWMGLHVELEHGQVSPETNVTNDDPILTGKIALAHLNEYPDYYTRLDIMEKEAEKKWGK